MFRRRPKTNVFTDPSIFPVIQPPPITLNVHVLYDGTDWTGMVAKYALWSKFRDNAFYHPIINQTDLYKLSLTKSDNLVIIGTFVSLTDILELEQRVKNIDIFTHYKTLYLKASHLDYLRYDVLKPDFVQAWEYYHHTRPLSKVMQHLASITFSPDLNEASIALLRHMERSGKFQNMAYWDELDRDNEVLTKAIASATIVQKALMQDIFRNITNLYFTATLNNCKVAIANASQYQKEIISAIFQRESLDLKYVWLYYIDNNGDMHITAQSRHDQNSYDVSLAINQLNGHSHKSLGYATVRRENVSSILDVMINLK